LIAGLLALALVATGAEATPGPAEHGPLLEVEACVRVDALVVQNLVDLELDLGDARARRPTVPISVAVRCLDGAQLIRVEPWASRGDDGLRTIELPDAYDEAAAVEARSRELALAIAELIRRLEITRPLPPEAPPPAPPPPPAPAAPPVVVAPSSPPDEPRHRWQLGALTSFDAFPGGPWLAGGDLSFGVSLGRWVALDLRAGGRSVQGLTSSSERLTARAAVASLGAGLNVWSQRHPIGFVAMLRAQGLGVAYRLGSAGEDPARTTWLDAFAASVEPRFLVRMSGHLTLALGGAAGLVLHGIVVRVQGVETSRMSGLSLSGNLGLVVEL
jgi:hypothetical protein